jgi:hypothetical protein
VGVLPQADNRSRETVLRTVTNVFMDWENQEFERKLKTGGWGEFFLNHSICIYPTANKQ